MRRKQQKRCSNVYTKSATCFSTYKLDLKNREGTLYSSVMSHKNVTKVVWYILVQVSSLNNTMSMVSGVSVQISRFRGSEFRGSGLWLLVPIRWLFFYALRITSDPFLSLFNL